MVVAFGEALLGPAGLSLLCQYIPAEKRGRAIAILFFGVTLGNSLAFGGGGAMLDLAKVGTFQALPGFANLADWREVMILLGALGLFLIPIVLTFKEPKRTFSSQSIDKDRFKDLIRIGPVLWLVLFAGSSVAIADFAYTTWQSALLTRTYGVSTGEAGQSLGLTALIAGTIGAWIGGVVSDKVATKSGALGRVKLVLMCAPALFAAAAILLIPGKWMAVLAYLAWQLVANVVYVAIAVTLQDFLTDRTRGIGSSMQTCLSIGLGLGFGPTIVAMINTSIGQGANTLTQSIMIFVGGAAIVTLMLAWRLHFALKGKRPTRPDPS
jgi:predicted MFS family arabinose efflux permease